MRTSTETEIRWPSGSCWTIGILRRSPEQLSATISLVFSDGYDDLDDYAAAAVFDDQISWFLLFRHAGSPSPGTEVKVDLGVTRRDGLGAVARCLGVDIRGFEWLTPYESFDAAQLDRPSLLDSYGAPERVREHGAGSVPNEPRKITEVRSVRRLLQPRTPNFDQLAPARQRAARSIAEASVDRGEGEIVASILHYRYKLPQVDFLPLFGIGYSPNAEHVTQASEASLRSAQRIFSLTNISLKARKPSRATRRFRRLAPR